MKVSDLIALLQQLAPDSYIATRDDDGDLLLDTGIGEELLPEETPYGVRIQVMQFGHKPPTDDSWR
jgi:hypothetical protein